MLPIARAVGRLEPSGPVRTGNRPAPGAHEVAQPRRARGARRPKPRRSA